MNYFEGKERLWELGDDFATVPSTQRNNVQTFIRQTQGQPNLNKTETVETTTRTVIADKSEIETDV